MKDIKNLKLDIGKTKVTNFSGVVLFSNKDESCLRSLDLNFGKIKN